MTILQIAVLAVLALGIGRLRRGRDLAMLATSALAVFWLQPRDQINSLQYWLPFATLAAAVLAWAVTSTPETRNLKQNWPAALVLVGAALLADVNRYAGLQAIFTTLTPAIPLVLSATALLAVVVVFLVRWGGGHSVMRYAALFGIVAAFLVLKTPVLNQRMSSVLIAVTDANPTDPPPVLAWLGFSYLAFRLLHTIRDRQTGRLPAVALVDYLNYAIFFPSFTAGPIDRIERFQKDLRSPMEPGNEEWLETGIRLFGGLFKKFVVADLLGVIAINDVLVREVRTAPWMWVFLYAYAFRIFFDFSGYTDIAIALGRLMGIRLPENFAAPYLKPNLTQFWNSWHMTLTQWFRGYVFNPFMRAMRIRKNPLSTWVVTLLGQLGTMVLIGLWHGVTVSFVLWGLWHGIGLFIHNRWSDLVRPRMPAWTETRQGQRVVNGLGVLLTFNYVAVGWTFFSLSTPAIAWLAILKLLGLGR